MSVHINKERNTALFNLAADAFEAAQGNRSFGTPFGIFDGGWKFFLGFSPTEGPEKFHSDLESMLEALPTAGASLTGDFEFDQDWNLNVTVEATSHMDMVLGADNHARINVAVLENLRQPYFSISATTQAAGGLCEDLEPGGTVSCTVQVKDVDPQVFEDGARIFVALTYRPDETSLAHMGVQSAIIEGNTVAPPKDQPPTVVKPLEDITVKANETTVIDLSQVFDDPDNDNSDIEVSVAFNNNKKLVFTSIEGQMLTLTYDVESTGSARLIIKAESNGKSVTDNFTVTVEEAAGPPAPVATVYLPSLMSGYVMDSN
jgi:hypothetical protein